MDDKISAKINIKNHANAWADGSNGIRCFFPNLRVPRSGPEDGRRESASQAEHRARRLRTKKVRFLRGIVTGGPDENTDGPLDVVPGSREKSCSLRHGVRQECPWNREDGPPLASAPLIHGHEFLPVIGRRAKTKVPRGRKEA
jgi:hypothetical protein